MVLGKEETRLVVPGGCRMSKYIDRVVFSYFVQCIADSSVHISRITNVHSVSILNSANNHNSFSPLALGLQFFAMSSAGVRKSFRARAVSVIWLVSAIADPE